MPETAPPHQKQAPKTCLFHNAKRTRVCRLDRQSIVCQKNRKWRLNRKHKVVRKQAAWAVLRFVLICVLMCCVIKQSS